MSLVERLQILTPFCVVRLKDIDVTYDEFNDFCCALPATSHIVQWGNSHVWKVGEKVFAIGGWSESDKPAFSFKTSELNFQVLGN